MLMITIGVKVKCLLRHIKEHVSKQHCKIIRFGNICDHSSYDVCFRLFGSNEDNGIYS